MDIGGVDALLHVADISWGRVNKPADVLTSGQQIEAKVLKVDPAKHRISIGMKQLQPHPWEVVDQKYKAGDRVQGTVTRVAEFGAFVEIEKGVEGLIHLSEMSWSKKVRKPSDVVKPGDQVDVVILGVNQADRRVSLGLKQALGDPWAEVERKYPVGSVAEGTVISLQKFGAFVQLEEGVEGMIHVGDISAEKRINHPQDALKMGEKIKAQVLEVETAKRRLRLGMKQLVPTSLDEYIAEHREGDVVTGRMTDVSGGRARVELGEGVQAACRMSGEASPAQQEPPADLRSGDISSLTSMLEAKWKGGKGGGSKTGREPPSGPDPQFPHRQAGRGKQEDRSGTGVAAGEARDTRSRWATRAEGCPAGLGVGADGLGDVPIHSGGNRLQLIAGVIREGGAATPDRTPPHRQTRVGRCFYRPAAVAEVTLRLKKHSRQYTGRP